MNGRRNRGGTYVRRGVCGTPAPQHLDVRPLREERGGALRCETHDVAEEAGVGGGVRPDGGEPDVGPSARSEDPMELVDHAVRVGDVLRDSLADDGAEALRTDGEHRARSAAKSTVRVWRISLQK